MKVNNYQIIFNQEAIPDALDYMPFFRYLLVYCQHNLCPHKINYDYGMLDLIDGEVLANRLGLVMFKLKKETDLKEFTFDLKNEQDGFKVLKSGDFSNEFIEPICKEEFIMRLPPKFNSKITIEFNYGRGNEHARFSGIEGYRMSSKQGLKVNFQLADDLIQPSLEDLKLFLKS